MQIKQKATWIQCCTDSQQTIQIQDGAESFYLGNIPYFCPLLRFNVC